MIATGIGSLPGEDYAEAVRTTFGDLPDLPYVPELPGRGVQAGMIGRTLGLMVVDSGGGLDVDLVPAGWRLTGTTGSPGLDQRRAASLLGQDLDTVEELTQGYAGPVKTQVTGPWTLAATVEKPRGDKVLSDSGARRDLAHALAEAAVAHVRDLRRRIGGLTGLVVQVDEPALAAVLAGTVPTASGYGRHRSVEPPAATALLEPLVEALVEQEAEVWVHCCAARPPLGLLIGSGSFGLSVDFGLLGPADHDLLAEALESGRRIALGMTGTAKRVADDVQRFLDMVGLDLDAVGERIVLTPPCGLAGAPSPADARQTLRALAEAARG